MRMVFGSSIYTLFDGSYAMDVIPCAWALAHFGSADLNDQRRSKD